MKFEEAVKEKTGVVARGERLTKWRLNHVGDDPADCLKDEDGYCFAADPMYPPPKA